MAGDWIKVEKATARKIEVIRLSSRLKIPPDQGFGLCVRFWMWCDDQMTDQWISGMTLDDIDATVGHDGFADALVSVGWLNNSHGILSIPNFGRHLSAGAKTRGQAMNRMQKKRSSDQPVTEPLRKERNKSVTKTSPEKEKS